MTSESMIMELRTSDLVALRDITHGASTDYTRQVLCGVLIQTGPDGLAEAWATDSYMAVCRPLSFTLPEHAYVIFDAKGLKQATTSALKSNVVSFAIEIGAHPTIHAGANRFGLEPIEGEFPKMRQVVDDDYGIGHGEAVYKVGISAALIARAAKALSTPKKGSDYSQRPGTDILFEFKDNLKPVRVTSCVKEDSHGATAWLIPVRLPEA